jgi:hypothetical protein
MNLADLTAVVVAIVGMITPPLFAVSRGASWWVILLCALCGIIYGIGAAMISGKISYRLLDSQFANPWFQKLAFVGYMTFPILAISATIFLSLAITSAAIK